ncbi:hypothetical protein MtrunA17_Chr3g0098641 [Medicago truncatula]|uniref:Uncharacterized protein n=1 Tax=Medicago truncatula TaxID=3880 RepID=I3SBI4_MEDTR|nr:unknown [Medicago truncatula]RHN67064.1 hypothetical protein MtrunA17_Chr3g0098641 [Medicago truncatula]
MHDSNRNYDSNSIKKCLLGTTKQQHNQSKNKCESIKGKYMGFERNLQKQLWRCLSNGHLVPPWNSQFCSG